MTAISPFASNNYLSATDFRQQDQLSDVSSGKMSSTDEVALSSALDDIDRERYFSLLNWWLALHENIYHQWTKKLIEEDTFISWTRDLEYFTRRQNLGNHWTLLGTYFEASFAEHVTKIIARQTKETPT